MNLGKRGIFFTFIAITIMGVFILILTPQSEISLKAEAESVKERINVVNQYVSDIESNYYPTVLRASSQKSILSLALYMNQSGEYLEDFDQAFSEVMLYGTIEGVEIDSITRKPLMNESTVYNLTRKIEEIGLDTFGVNTSINVTSISIAQYTPWEIETSVSFNYTVISEVAHWSVRNTTIKTVISIEGWQDPAYLIETGGLYPNTIKRSRIEFSEWNISHVRDQIANGTYVHWPYSSAPSYLSRFEGLWMDSNSSCCGIHSLLRPGNLTNPDERRSYVDYMFWNGTLACSDLYNITQPNGQGPYTGGIWDQFRYFKLDFGHLIRYNISAEHYERGGC